MKIIFLDIDGVVNTGRMVRFQSNHGQGEIVFDRQAMWHLQEIVAAADAWIVITSTWRIHAGTTHELWAALIRNLQAYGLEQRILDITPVLDTGLKPSARREEIEAWLAMQAAGSVEAYVVLDDEWEMGSELGPYFVRCSGDMGISKEGKAAAIALLTHTNSV